MGQNCIFRSLTEPWDVSVSACDKMNRVVINLARKYGDRLDYTVNQGGISVLPRISVPLFICGHIKLSLLIVWNQGL